MIITPLLEWYLNHRLEVTQIYHAIQYTPFNVFQHFGEAVSDARRKGDADPDKKIVVKKSKLMVLLDISTSNILAFS